MSTYRVFCLETEAQNLPPETAVIEKYPGFVIISASTKVITEIQKNYPVEELPSPKNPPGIPEIAGLPVLMNAPQKRGPYFCAVRFYLPVRPAYLEEIEATDSQIIETIGRFTFVVKCPNKISLAKLHRLSTQPRVTRYIPKIRINPQFFAGWRSKGETLTDTATQAISVEPPPKRNSSLPGILVANFFTETEQQQAKRYLRRQGIGKITELGKTRLIIKVKSNNNPIQAVQAIATCPGLRSLEEKNLKTTFNNVARQVIADQVVTPQPTGLGLTGQGEIIAVADTGLDNGILHKLHEDLRGRVRRIQRLEFATSFLEAMQDSLVHITTGMEQPAVDKYSGHGTHVVGSILGNGARSKVLGGTPLIQGMAPEAKLFFQALELTVIFNELGISEWADNGLPAPAYGLYGVPDNLQDLFQVAYDEEARIHSNSWGSQAGRPGEYNEDCEEIDQFVWNHKDFLILFAAGNRGVDLEQPDIFHPPAADGVISLGSMTPPATAKNCLTVGATENPRPEFATIKYDDDPLDRWPNEPFKSDSLVDIDDIFAMSSRGPCGMGRRKPDVVAPGTFILSTRSSQLPPDYFGKWAKKFKQAPPGYMYDSGASMSTALVAGCAALVRQYLRQCLPEPQRIENPSAALLKTVLIHSAQYKPYRFAHPESRPPHASIRWWADNEQGWGRVDLDQILKKPEAITKVFFIDETQGLQTGDSYQIKIRVPASTEPLRLTMVYTDLPGEDLVNDLNLLANSPSGKSLIGNDFNSLGAPDSVNNVEGIIETNPEAGVWTIRVEASNVDVRAGPQDFALVISGERIELVSSLRITSPVT